MMGQTKKPIPKNPHKTKKIRRDKKLIQAALCETNYKSFEKDIAILDKNTQNYETFLIKKFNTPFSPLKIKPEDDFYTFVNFYDLKETEKQTKKYQKDEKYFTQVDSFRILQHKVYIELLDLVKILPPRPEEPP